MPSWEKKPDIAPTSTVNIFLMGGLKRPGSHSHVVNRGIQRTLIFRNDKDRDPFLDWLAGILPESSTPWYPWSPMP